MVKMDICREMPWPECIYLSDCAFFTEFSNTELSSVLHELKRIYCLGPFAADCLRRRHAEREGHMPSASYSPTGVRYDF